MTRTIVITSGKGGVGKTTTTANIGTSLALMGKSVCLIDLDFGLRNLDIPLGLSNRIIFDIFDYIHGRSDIERTLVKDKQLPNLSFLPGSKESSILNNQKLYEDSIHHLQKNGGFDYILIDCPAGIENGFRAAVSCAEEAIVITTIDRSAIQDADRVIGLLEDEYALSPRLLINRYKEDKKKQISSFTAEEIASNLTVPLLGTIYEDEEIMTSVNNGKAIAFSSHLNSALRFRHITRNLIKKEITAFIPTPETKTERKITTTIVAEKLFGKFEKRKKVSVRL